MVFLEWGGTGLSFTAHKVKFVAWAYEYQVESDRFCLSRRRGGGTQVQRGAAPALRISRKKGSFLKTSACPRFSKRRVLFCTQVRSMGVKIPLQSTKYTYAAPPK